MKLHICKTCFLFPFIVSIYTAKTIKSEAKLLAIRILPALHATIKNAPKNKYLRGLLLNHLLDNDNVISNNKRHLMKSSKIIEYFIDIILDKLDINSEKPIG